MSLILWLLLALLAALLVAVLALVLLPLRIRLEAATAPEPRLALRVAALGGAVPALPVFDSTRPRKPPKAKTAGPEEKKKTSAQGKARRKRLGGERALALLRNAPGLVRGILGAFHFTRLEAEGDYGFADPADTGQVFGFLSAFTYGLPPRPGLVLNLRPDFAGERLDGRVEAEISVVPAALLPPLVSYGWRVFGPGGRA